MAHSEVSRECERLGADKIVIPTDTMEQEFQQHYRRGYEAGKKASTPQPTQVQPIAQEAEPLLDYAMQIAHERELRVTGFPHDEDGAKRVFEAAVMRHTATGAAEADSVQEDAARYRWLREGNDAKHGAAWHVAVNLYGCEWDAAIDAARKREANRDRQTKHLKISLSKKQASILTTSPRRFFGFARAVLAKWGQPAQARAGEVPLDEARRLFDAGWKAAALFCDREDVVADGIIGFGACPQFEAAFSAAHGIKGGQHVS